MATYIRLTSGLVVANMSSPHPFTFTTGETLPACSPEEAQALKLDAVEVERPGVKGTIDIELTFKLNDVVRARLDELEALPGIDIVLVPFPVMEALKREGRPVGKCRVIRTADRVTKAIFPDKFCI